jgi:4-amino-4-deoxy-L-arabinose transferase-like glycosyltransferase
MSEATRPSEPTRPSEATRPSEPTRLERSDFMLAGAFGTGYLALVFGSARSLGYTRDEGFYTYAARVLELWFARIADAGSAAFERTNIDHFWNPVHEHPGLMKLLFALSHHFLHERWALIREPGTAYRFPGMLMGALAVAVLYLWGREAGGRTAGVVSALLFALMPRVFFHAHLACLDVAVTAMWLVTSYVYVRAFRDNRLTQVIGAGVLYGFFLDTKHNAWLFPFALLVHLAALRLHEKFRHLPRCGPRVPWALVSVVLLGPLVLWAIWPWLWFDTTERVRAWFEFHLQHDYYNMEFLGRTYWKPPMPALYAPVMTLATVPAVTLALFALGLFAIGRALVRGVESERFVHEALWLVGFGLSYAPWLSRNTPIFGGTKHWMPAYPYLCLIAGRGFVFASGRLRALWAERFKKAELAEPVWAERFKKAELAEPVVAALCLAGPLVMTLHSHPWGLTFYTPLAGGAPGAASCGLNRTFWGYATGALTNELNELAPPNAAVYVHDTALQSWQLLQEDGRVRSDLTGTLSLPASSLALYHHEAHMRRVEYETWVVYGTVSPVAIGSYDGVPVVWLYQRPESRRP